VQRITVSSHKTPVAERPLIVAQRSRVGDWEGDTARGGDKKSVLVVHTERKSGFVTARPLARATADAVHATAVSTFKGLPVSTITYDNGSEFALHQMIENDLSAPVYFARPGHPEERGTCENTIGLLREFFPKGTRFDIIQSSVVAKAVWNLNHRPRKRHSWQTPCTMFGHCCS
jgi:IS30 family transposase